jgi:hypothetical protein
VEELQIEHASGQWMRFIDSSKVCLKAVFLHCGNKFLPVTLARAVRERKVREPSGVAAQNLI